MTDTTQTAPDQTNPDQTTRYTTPDTSGIPAPVDIYGPQPAAYRAMVRLEQAARDGVGDDTIFELVKLRASQINGCGYCVDMHSKDLLAGGETPQRLVLLDAWREAPIYTRAERAALALTEAVTTVADGHPSAEVEAEAREVFDEGAYAGLVVAIATINAWNRLAITSHAPVGSYQPA
ncbi:carboxymuconolactone decarboxylase family protein [Janibacter alkaliphilus]|uniref:AhpD family alkylhydroperoxidase n=1 Tax=Janibacter alkaliphilus TaxID=1069963 RepID=A0A852X0E3_9MICO|nr:carboxymuconolactone decarboxylase family protein [Janibacter alkaliphilus]NYG36319.1 AhpD family alkylhydroperoxidase [Janibacter alkaliphilus]